MHPVTAMSLAVLAGALTANLVVVVMLPVAIFYALGSGEFAALIGENGEGFQLLAAYAWLAAAPFLCLCGIMLALRQNFTAADRRLYYPVVGAVMAPMFFLLLNLAGPALGDARNLLTMVCGWSDAEPLAVNLLMLFNGKAGPGAIAGLVMALAREGEPAAAQRHLRSDFVARA